MHLQKKIPRNHQYFLWGVSKSNKILVYSVFFCERRCVCWRIAVINYFCNEVNFQVLPSFEGAEIGAEGLQSCELCQQFVVMQGCIMGQIAWGFQGLQYLWLLRLYIWKYTLYILENWIVWVNLIFLCFISVLIA